MVEEFADNLFEQEVVLFRVKIASKTNWKELNRAVLQK